MLSISHVKMPAVSTSNLGEIWRSKKQQPVFQWCKQISEREKNEMWKEAQAKKRTVQIISRTSEMNPDVKPFHPRNKGLARSEGLWEMYCSQSELVVFDQSVKNGRSSWPDVRPHETGESSFHFRLYGEKDFWGYVLPNTLFTQERDFSWGLSVPTDWQSPVHVRFPVTLLEDELTWEDSSVKPKSEPLDSYNVVTPGFENGKCSQPENTTASEKTDTAQKAEEILEKNNSSPENEQSSEVTLSRRDEDKTKVSSNLTYSMKDLLFGTPRSDSRKRRKLPGISRIMNESCAFYKSNSPPVLTVL